MRAPTHTYRAGSLHCTAPHLQNFRPGLAVERWENWGTTIAALTRILSATNRLLVDNILENWGTIAGLGGRVEEPQSLHLHADLAWRNSSSSSDSVGDSTLQPITYIVD